MNGQLSSKTKHWYSINFKATIIASMVVALLFSTFSSVLVTNAKTVSEMTPTEEAKSILYYNALVACIENAAVNGGGTRGDVSPEGITSGKWFKGGMVNPTIGFPLGAMGVSVDGFPKADSSYAVECGGDNVKWISDAMSLWGYSDNLTAWCDLTGSLKRSDDTLCSGSASTRGWDPSDAKTALEENFKKTILQKVYGGSGPSKSDAAKFAHARAAFYGGCLRTASPQPYTGTESGDTVFKDVPLISADGSNATTVTFVGVRKATDKVWWAIDANKRNLETTCSDLVSQMTTYAKAYLKVVSDIPDNPTNSDGSTTDSATTTSCSIDGIGWIVCPIMNFLAEVSDASFTFLADNFLSTNTSVVEASDDNGVYAGWKLMRNVANVLFIIAFLIIVFSQMTGAGVSNYGVKKMLPRLVVAAILVNLSFYICQIAVDLSNILGFTIKGFFESIGASIDIAEEAANGADIGNRFTSVVATVLALGAGATLLYVYIGALAPVLLAAVVALIMILFILLTRQVLIVLLIVLAPVAFVAFLLPNTQKWFDAWRKTFVALLVVFPVIALVYGGAALASQVLASTYQTDGAGNDSVWGQIMAAAILILPLFIVPVLLKKSLDGIYGIGGRINSFGAKVQGGARKKGTEAYNNSRLGQFKAFRKKENATRRAMIQSGSYSGGGIRGAMSNVNKKINESDLSGKFGNQALTTGYALADKEEAEIVSNAQAAVLNKSMENPAEHSVEKQFEAALKSGDVVTAKAAQNILMGKGGPGVKSVRDIIQTVHQEIDPATNKSTLTPEMRKVVANNTLNNHALTAKQKSNDLLKWSTEMVRADRTEEQKNVGVDDIAARADTWKDLSPVDLVGQTDDAFKEAIQSGGVSMETIESIQTGQVNEQLTEKKRKLISP